MRTAIIYTTKYGTTEKVAASIAEKLKGTNTVEMFSLNTNTYPNIQDFETVILGTPIYAGQAPNKIKAFCKANKSVLLQKMMGLFVCGMHPDKEQQHKELKDAYPEVLLKNATVAEFMGGAFLFERMNFFERLIIKKIAKTTTSIQQIDLNVVDEFVAKLK